MAAGIADRRAFAGAVLCLIGGLFAAESHGGTKRVRFVLTVDRLR